jgi:antitoxin MazE
MYHRCRYDRKSATFVEDSMIVQFARWGNSLAVRIPSAFAREIQAVEGRSADLSVQDGRLIVTPINEVPCNQLADLVDGIMDENLHGEIGTGPAVGNEFA